MGGALSGDSLQREIEKYDELCEKPIKKSPRIDSFLRL